MWGMRVICRFPQANSNAEDSEPPDGPICKLARGILRRDPGAYLADALSKIADGWLQRRIDDLWPHRWNTLG
jgi:hypothetical protein